MANPNFVANFSTNEIYRNENTDRCLTDAALQEANKRIEALEYKVATLDAHKCNCK